MAADPELPGRVFAPTGRELWHARVSATPDAPFLLCGSRSWTFAGADDRMRRMAAGLAGHGVGPGVRVAVGLANDDDTLLLHAALRELRAVIVPLVPGLTGPEVCFQLAHSGSALLIVGEPLSTVIASVERELPAALQILRADQGALEALAGADPLPGPGIHADEPDDDMAPWAIFYTSGSTGRPKGVVLPAGAFASAGSGYADRFQLRAQDNYLLATPMGHAVGGLTAQAMSLYTGCRLTIVERFRPSRFWDEVQDAQATVSILFPAHLNLLVETRDRGPAAGASSLRLVITHGWHHAFRERFGVELALCWGMTETGAASTGTPPGRPPRRPGDVGHGMHGVELSVVDGEIRLRHRHRMLGYLNDPAATTQTVTADGWVRSGDTGELDADGELIFAGRIKNMIKRSGENISPEEIENALTAHPGILEALVLGVPDALRTEEVAAVVVLAPGVDAPAPDLIAFLADRLATFKLPRYLAVRQTALPRLPAGKVDRATVVRELDLTRCWDRQRQANRPSKP